MTGWRCCSVMDWRMRRGLVTCDQALSNLPGLSAQIRWAMLGSAPMLIFCLRVSQSSSRSMGWAHTSQRTSPWVPDLVSMSFIYIAI